MVFLFIRFLLSNPKFHTPALGGNFLSFFLYFRRPNLITGLGKLKQIRTGFPPGFFLVSRTCHDALSTKNWEKVSVSVFVTIVTV